MRDRFSTVVVGPSNPSRFLKAERGGLVLSASWDDTRFCGSQRILCEDADALWDAWRAVGQSLDVFGIEGTFLVCPEAKLVWDVSEMAPRCWWLLTGAELRDLTAARKLELAPQWVDSPVT